MYFDVLKNLLQQCTRLRELIDVCEVELNKVKLERRKYHHRSSPYRILSKKITRLYKNLSYLQSVYDTLFYKMKEILLEILESGKHLYPNFRTECSDDYHISYFRITVEKFTFPRIYPSLFGKYSEYYNYPAIFVACFYFTEWVVEQLQNLVNWIEKHLRGLGIPLIIYINPRYVTPEEVEKVLSKFGEVVRNFHYYVIRII